MTFKFSDTDRTLTVHHFDHEGVYLSSQSLLIVANFGLPAQSTTEALPELLDNQTAVFRDGKWQALSDSRGQVAYAKSREHEDNYTVEEFGYLPTTHTLQQPNEFDSWCAKKQHWLYDKERELPVKSAQETAWRDAELLKVLNRIDQYEKDKNYPAELRTSPINSEDAFLNLLKDRKLLSDYPQCEGFPFVDRPTLSGLAT